MPLPPPKRLRAGRQMQVEPCEIPFAGTPEILRPREMSIEAYLANVRRNKPAPCLTRGRMSLPARRQGERRRWAFFSSLLSKKVF
jgi:hypothetical protein